MAFRFRSPSVLTLALASGRALKENGTEIEVNYSAIHLSGHDEGLHPGILLTNAPLVAPTLKRIHPTVSLLCVVVAIVEKLELRLLPQGGILHYTSLC